MSNQDDDPADLEQLLDRIEENSQDQTWVTIGEMLDAVGRRSFGPLVLLAGVILVTPLSGMPGMPTMMGVLLLLTLGQLLVGREYFWLPDWITERQVPRERLLSAFNLMRPTAKAIDELMQPRITGLVKGSGLNVMASACLVIGFLMPATEIIPFSSSVAGVALMAFGLAMIARDGVVALIAWGVLLLTPTLVLVGLI